MATILELNNVSKSFNYPVLKNCCYSFFNTGLYAIYGVSGSGKSTLLNIIAGYEEIDSGEISVGYQTLEYVMQEHMLFNNITVRDNLYLKLNVTDYPVNQYDILIDQTVKKLSVSKLLAKKVSILSGGEKQRVALARSLLTTPDVIILDEPTANIDQKLKDNLLLLLSELAKERLILITTHDPIVKSYADHMLYLERGQLYE